MYTALLETPTNSVNVFVKPPNWPGETTLIVVGDFSAQNTERGYKQDTIKGRNLWLDAHREGLTLITHPTQPTRMGNRASGDTTPDLAFTKNTCKDATWLKSQENLGNDHYTVVIVV